jgi:anti-sigma B factor antagonist
VKPAGDELRPDGGEILAGPPDREQLLTVERIEEPDALILAVKGAVDGLTAPRLRAAIADGFDQLRGRPLVLDLTLVRFLGSAGLRTLHDAAREAEHRPDFTPLRIVVDQNRPVVRPIEIVGLDGILALYEDVADAVRGESTR